MRDRDPRKLTVGDIEAVCDLESGRSNPAQKQRLGAKQRPDRESGLAWSKKQDCKAKTSAKDTFRLLDRTYERKVNAATLGETNRKRQLPTVHPLGSLQHVHSHQRSSHPTVIRPVLWTLRIQIPLPVHDNHLAPIGRLWMRRSLLRRLPYDPLLQILTPLLGEVSVLLQRVAAGARGAGGDERR